MSNNSKVKYPIAILWKIAENRLQEMKDSINGYLQSTVFSIPDTDVKYFIYMYPNGNEEKYRGRTMVWFCLNYKEKKEIEAEFTFSIESARFTKTKKFVFKEANGRGGSLCTTDELFDPEQRFIIDGEMEIKLEGFVMIEKEYQMNSFELGSCGVKLCTDLWNDDNSKDFTIVADGKEIYAHKLILSNRSPVFAAMFQPHTKEAQENKVVIPDFSFDIVEYAIKFCYDSSLVKELFFEERMLLLQFFDKYDIELLKADLEAQLISEVNEFNVCRLANCSLLSNAAKLRKVCGEFLQARFRDNECVSDFDLLDKDFAYELFKNSLFKRSI